MEQARLHRTSAPPLADRRMEVRLDAGCEIDVLVLTDVEDIPLRGTVRNFSGRGLSLDLPQGLVQGTAVRLDIDGRMLLGEVIHSTPADDRFHVGVELQHSVTWTRDLVRLLDALGSYGG